MQPEPSTTIMRQPSASWLTPNRARVIAITLLVVGLLAVAVALTSYFAPFVTDLIGKNAALYTSIGTGTGGAALIIGSLLFIAISCYCMKWTPKTGQVS